MSVGSAANFLLVKFPFLDMKARDEKNESPLLARDNNYRVSFLSDEQPKDLRAFKRELHKELIHLQLVLWGALVWKDNAMEFTVVGDSERCSEKVKEYILKGLEADDSNKRKRQ